MPEVLIYVMMVTSVCCIAVIVYLWRKQRKAFEHDLIQYRHFVEDIRKLTANLKGWRT
jgi:hypothetical protein